MAEIRSTMDMVMERAAKMAAESKSDAPDDSVMREGMRMAAEFLNAPEGNLLDVLQAQPQEKQAQLIRGVTDTLLRNIVLPRDDFLLEGGMRALPAIAEIVPGEGRATCQELQQILNQYSQHKEQMKGQLDDAIRRQLQQRLAQQGAQLSDDVSINPAMHPQYKEELENMLSNLNGQYNEALDQRKEMLRQLVQQA